MEDWNELLQAYLCCDHLVMHLYPAGVCPHEIDTYEDFVNSKCEMIVLAYDGSYVEVYCKQAQWIHRLLQNAKAIPGTQFCPKYVETDTRTTMYV